MKELIKKLEKSYKQIEGRTQSVAVSLNTEELDLIIQSLTQEPSAVSAEELELAESIIKKRYPFYDSNIDGKDIEINGKIAVELMQEYANASMRNNQWVSVDERLPENKEIVIICWEYKGVKKITSGSYNVLQNYWQHAGATQLNVTHWMPLPQLP